MALSKARRLNRFLIITGRTAIPVGAFTTEMVLQFRQFVYDEYRYVAQFPALYPRGTRHRRPSRQMKNTTVVHDLKLLQAFFAELENTGEISRSPFRRISMEKRRHIMHVMYDAPVFLRADEMKQVLTTTVPPNLQWAKDLFVLNCAIGCRGNTGTGSCFAEKGIELQTEMSVAQFFFVSFYILIWLVKTILLYLSAERGFKKLKETRVLDLIKVNYDVKC